MWAFSSFFIVLVPFGFPPNLWEESRDALLIKDVKLIPQSCSVYYRNVISNTSFIPNQIKIVVERLKGDWNHNGIMTLGYLK